MTTKRITQREIAKLAGVSQVAVSMVLNDPSGATTRISPATRERIQQVIHDTGYVVDAAARRLAGLDNKIVGVFTYEHALSPQMMDFYGPLLNGLERAAERLGCDLLFFTGTPAESGSKRIFHPATRLRLADGCILLGKEMHSGDLTRLVKESFPFVAVGRRDELGVPYVGIEYISLTTSLLSAAAERGHTEAVYVHQDKDTPSSNDRLAAIDNAESDGLLRISKTSVEARSIQEISGQLTSSRATLAIVEDLYDAIDLVAALSDLGIAVPADMSLAVLAEVNGHRVGDRQLSGFNLPREHIASEALELLQSLILAKDTDAPATQTLLHGSIQIGETLVPAKGEL